MRMTNIRQVKLEKEKFIHNTDEKLNELSPGRRFGDTRVNFKKVHWKK